MCYMPCSSVKSVCAPAGGMTGDSRGHSPIVSCCGTFHPVCSARGHSHRAFYVWEGFRHCCVTVFVCVCVCVCVGVCLCVCVCVCVGVCVCVCVRCDGVCVWMCVVRGSGLVCVCVRCEWECVCVCVCVCVR